MLKALVFAKTLILVYAESLVPVCVEALISKCVDCGHSATDLACEIYGLTLL